MTLESISTRSVVRIKVVRIIFLPSVYAEAYSISMETWELSDFKHLSPKGRNTNESRSLLQGSLPTTGFKKAIR